MSDVKFESRCKDCKNHPCNGDETLYCIFYNYKNFEQKVKVKETKTMTQRTIKIDGDK